MWNLIALANTQLPASSPSSDSCSTMSSPSIIVCDAPLVAPVPLPYHSPRFLQFDRLPDMDQDLSHPPYTHRHTSRKRKADVLQSDHNDQPPQHPSKRRLRLKLPAAHLLHTTTNCGRHAQLVGVS
ncbi:hypothetical protein FA15DRAFT_663039 [Coprinopsis marcescibilis]|uniref:Uncharacterized protein n=1 Tax=Coprinopsis marcescibilis TaxID=230819 RepID=A0A5C3LAJ4_COPMA|nr:hypothetical protein FA15DRAFT_663039 [Coprinopsis marcescibilis]